MSGAARYAAVLRIHVALLVASMLARLPYGLFGLAVILYLAEARGSYAVAGMVNGAFAIGAAVGVPWQSRIIDRLGQRRVLLPAAVVDATATGLLIALTEAGAPTLALVVCDSSAALPCRTSAARCGRSGRSCSPAATILTSTAFALDSVAIELLFTLGPLVAALIIAVASPVTALVASAACVLTGTIMFVTRPPSREWRPHAQADRMAASAHCAPRACGRSRSRRFRSASARRGRDQPSRVRGGARRTQLAGVLLATWAIASAIGGLHGARSWPRPLGAIYLGSPCSCRSGTCPALLSPSIPAMALLILPAGLLIAPLGAAGNQLIGRRAGWRGDGVLRLAGHGDPRRLRRRVVDRRAARRDRRLARMLRRRGALGRHGRRRRLPVPRHAGGRRAGPGVAAPSVALAQSGFACQARCSLDSPS